NPSNHNACIQENLDAGKVKRKTESAQQYVLLPLWSTGSKDPQNTDADAAFDDKENESEVHVSPSSSDKPKKHDEKAKIEAKGKSPVDLSIGVRDLRDEFEEFSVHSTNGVNAASTPVTAIGLNLTNSTNSFNAVGPSDNAVSHNFEVGGKSSFAEADFSNLETSITVSPIPTTIVYKNYPVTQIIGDLTSAPQTRNESNLWHRRLGHINFKTMNKLVKGNLVRGLPSKVFENNHTCVACKKGKQHRASCKFKPVSSVSQPLQKLHMDLFGLIFVKSLNKKSYCLVVTDDYSRFSWVFFLATKDETSTILKTFITTIENQINHKVNIIRSDNGTEFKNHDLNQFYRMKGIKREFSVARTPQQNGIAERKNRTLIEAARTMLADLLLPIPFWAEAVNTICYLQNRVLVTKPHNKTPYELLLGRKPSIGFMRPFGCPITILNTLDPLEKFDGKADEGFLVGYSVNSNAFRSMNYQPVVTENQPNSSAGIQENFNAGKVRKESVSTQQYVLLPLWSTGSKDPPNTDADAAFDDKKNESEVHVSPSSSDKPKKHDKKAKREGKGKSPIDLFIRVRDLSDEFKEFSVNSTNRVNAVSTPVIIVRPNSTNNTNIFNVAGTFDNAVSPNFEIVGKSSFVDPSQYPNDLDMPVLEDIIYSDDEEDVSVEADFSNLETTPQTRSMTRMVKEQGGLAQINNEDFHTCIFAYFLSQEEPKRVHQTLKDPSWTKAMQEELLQFKMQKVWVQVYKVVKALYGLHQASRAWYETLANYILENGFQRGKIDQTLFIKKQKGDILLVQVYVDDIIFGSTNKELCKAFEKLMKDKFHMSSMGELTFFLGLQVKQKDNRIFISQDKYVAKLLKKCGLTEGKSASTPIDPEKTLLKDPNVKRIFRYLKGKPHLGLWYPKDSPFNLVAYFDSDYTGASLDRKSTTGSCQFQGCRLISWKCKKQNVVATSSTKAEYVAAASYCAQVLWIQNQLLDYGKGFDQIVDFLTAHLIQYALMFNPTIYVSCIKQFWALVSIKKSNDVMKLQALIDRKKVIITEDTIRQALRLDDADGINCLPNEEIFAELARMGYEKPGLPGMNLVLPRPQLLSALQQDDAEVQEDEDDNKVHASSLLPTPATTPPPPQQESIPSPPQAQSTQPSSLPQQQPSPPADISMTLLNKLMETCATLTQKVANLEQDKIAQALEITKLKQMVRRLEKKRRTKHSGLNRLKKVGALMVCFYPLIKI
nr:putative ribonuclease H-like domain-containing protein [Tanacetum cinerariifolium]